jgi:hypothetical protein
VQSVWREGAEKPQLQPHEELGDGEEGGEEHAVVDGHARLGVAPTKPAPAKFAPAAPELPVPDIVTPPAPPLPAAPALSSADLQRLRSSLDIMVECRRRIDHVLAG